MRLLEQIFHPRFAGREGSTARREVDQWITKWLGRYRSPPPRKYTTCGEGGGGKKGK